VRLLSHLLSSADRSPRALATLNLVLPFVVPYNRPHRFRVREITDERCEISIPLIRANKNHIGGLHACALATASEFASGLLLLRALEVKRYRLILSSLAVKYLYQGRTAAVAQCHMSSSSLTEIRARLLTEGKIEVTSDVETHDTAGNLLTSSHVVWQVKEWSKVRTARQEGPPRHTV
jgi:acyl-coenzyme A thioesterase PaaI-like protein